MRQGLARLLHASPPSLWWLGGLWAFYRLPALPPAAFFAPLAALLTGLLLLRLWRPAVVVLAVLLAWHDAGLRLAQRLPEGQPVELRLTVSITGLPRTETHGTRFEGQVLHGERQGQRLRLFWPAPAPSLEAGEHWRLQLRLRALSGHHNPGGFDFEGWAFRQRLAATGTVKQGLLLGHEPNLDRWRGRVATWLEGLPAPDEGKALLRALLLGDRRGLSDRQWESLAATGTGHLMAISGLHLGLLALWIYWPVRWLMAGFRLPCRWLPAREWALLATLPVTLAYALLAGFSLPTQRAWLMLLLYVSSRLLLRRFSLWQILAFSAVALTVLDPTQVLSAGFWLSFVAVAVLGLASGGLQAGTPSWLGALRAQAAISAAMLPLGLLWFGRASLLSLPVNLVLIPMMAWLILPVGMLGLALAAMLPDWGGPVLSWTAGTLAWVQQTLHGLAALPAMTWQPSGPGWPWLFSLVAVLWWLKRPPTRTWSWLLWALLAFTPLGQWAWQASRNPPVLDLWVLDTGQGLSAVLRTGGHTLVYDSGPSFRNGGAMAERVLLPFLQRMGIRRVDTYIASHADDDHAGGTAALLRQVPVERFLSSAGHRFPEAEPCHRDDGWQWGEVRFRLLYPRPMQPYLGNDSSCVLLVQWQEHRLLLPGDAGHAVEWVLLNRQPQWWPLDVILPGHHGSQTASGEAFVARARPRHAVFAAGRNNRFGFPRPQVVERYRRVGSALHHTGGQGAVQLRLHADGRWQTRHWRGEHRRLWHHPPVAP